MSNFDFLVSGAYLPFTISLGLMFGIGVLEAIGLGLLALDLDFDLDADHDANGFDFLGWLGVGQVPIMVVLVSLLTIFGILGFFIQNTADAFLGGTIWVPFAIMIALTISLPVTGVVSRFLGRILPTEETTIISDDDLIGQRAMIILGTAQVGNPSKAKLTDSYGLTHYIMVEPDFGEAIEGDVLILVRRENAIFVGTSTTPSPLRSI